MPVFGLTEAVSAEGAHMPLGQMIDVIDHWGEPFQERGHPELRQLEMGWSICLDCAEVNP
jgi:hypothetical protein